MLERGRPRKPESSKQLSRVTRRDNKSRKDWQGAVDRGNFYVVLDKKGPLAHNWLLRRELTDHAGVDCIPGLPRRTHGTPRLPTFRY